MVAVASARLAGLPPTSYYAPDYRIEVEGRELDPESKGDVLEVKVVMDMVNMSSFDLTINNWDDKRLRFKYSDTATFDVGNRVHVQMGYADRLRSMVRGQVSSLAPKFPESGSPTIAVSGLDGMLRLRDRKPAAGETTKYVKMADWEIAQAVAARNQLKVRVTQEGPQHALVVQKNQADAQFLMERAKRIDFDCYVQTDAATGEDTLVFMKPTDARDSRGAKVYVFEWGKTLASFNPQLNLSRQVSKVTVRGWDSRAKAAIVYTTTPADLPGGGSGGGTSGPDAARTTLGDKQDVVVDAPVASEEEARRLAQSLLRERAYEFITGSGRVIGLPDLRPGDNVELQNVGKRFSGTYYVTKVEHTLGSGGYLTGFDVRRVFDGGLQ
jgi:Bacteriophage probable baseplate hub protein